MVHSVEGVGGEEGKFGDHTPVESGPATHLGAERGWGWVVERFCTAGCVRWGHLTDDCVIKQLDPEVLGLNGPFCGNQQRVQWRLAGKGAGLGNPSGNEADDSEKVGSTS